LESGMDLEGMTMQEAYERFVAGGGDFMGGPLDGLGPVIGGPYGGLPDPDDQDLDMDDAHVQAMMLSLTRSLDADDEDLEVQDLQDSAAASPKIEELGEDGAPTSPEQAAKDSAPEPGKKPADDKPGNA